MLCGNPQQGVCPEWSVLVLNSRCTLIFNGKGRSGVEDSTTKWSVRVVARGICLKSVPWLLYLININFE